MDELVRIYETHHQNPWNRRFHLIGVPTIFLSLFIWVYSAWLALALFVVGWSLQFVGHYLEGKSPAFFSHPKFLLVGVAWWLHTVGKLLGFRK